MGRFRCRGESCRGLIIPLKETIERQSGSLVGLPKLVFDPAYFEEQHGARRIFKPRNDAELAWDIR